MAAAAGAGLAACGSRSVPAAGLVRFADGLNNPRGIAFDASGNLLVAEAGYGTGEEPTGRLTRIDPSGGKSVLIDRLPYGFDPEGENVGLSAVLARGDEILLLMGQGQGDPFQKVLILKPDVPIHTFNDLGVMSDTVIDILALRNPFDMAFAPDGQIWIVDSETNDIMRVSANGRNRERVVNVAQAMGTDQVPTGIDFGPDGHAYVAMFTRRPHVRRSSWVARIDGQGQIEPAMLGLSMAIDVAFDGSGRLYALEFSQAFAIDRPGLYEFESGRLLRGSGRRTEVLAEGLPFPTSVAFGPDGDCYIALSGAFGGQGDGWIGRLSVPA